jgi:uncharacterized protein
MVSSHGRFVWYGLMTTDVAVAKAFYAKVVGWSTQDTATPGGTYTLCTAGRTPVCGLSSLPEDARAMGVAPKWIGYVGVDDVDVTADRIVRLGGAIYIPPTDVPNISRFSIVADPQMATLALFKWHQPGGQQPAALGEPGHVGWHELLTADCEQAFADYGELFGWRKANADRGPIGAYQLFSVAGQTIGGICAKPAKVPDPFWLFYFNVGDVDAAVERVKAAGGEVLEGPVDVSSGSWIARCTDPQGAMFALEGKRNRSAVGYFERGAARDPRDRRWSW